MTEEEQARNRAAEKAEVRRMLAELRSRADHPLSAAEYRRIEAIMENPIHPALLAQLYGEDADKMTSYALTLGISPLRALQLAACC